MKRRIVVKVGSNVLTRDDGKLDVTRMSALVDQIAWLRKHDIEVILVSSRSSSYHQEPWPVADASSPSITHSIQLSSASCSQLLAGERKSHRPEKPSFRPLFHPGPQRFQHRLRLAFAECPGPAFQLSHLYGADGEIRRHLPQRRPVFSGRSGCGAGPAGLRLAPILHPDSRLSRLDKAL